MEEKERAKKSSNIKVCILIYIRIISLSYIEILGSNTMHYNVRAISIYSNIVLVVTPKPACDVAPPSSMFSVTGFLTFTVVAATSLANIITNINNNNNNNNDNNNNENQNDNNQVSDNTMADRRRKRGANLFLNRLDFCENITDEKDTSFMYIGSAILRLISANFDFCPEKYVCNAALESNLLTNTIQKRVALITTTVSAFILSDMVPKFNHTVATEIIQNVTMSTLDCSTIHCYNQ